MVHVSLYVDDLIYLNFRDRVGPRNVSSTIRAFIEQYCPNPEEIKAKIQMDKNRILSELEELDRKLQVFDSKEEIERRRAQQAEDQAKKQLVKDHLWRVV